MKIIKKRGFEENFDKNKLLTSVEKTGAKNAELVLENVIKHLDGKEKISSTDISNHVQLVMLNLVPEDIKYHEAVRNYLLWSIYKDVWGKERLYRENLSDLYRYGFKDWLNYGLKNNIFDKEKVKFYLEHIDELARYIRPERDLLLTYNSVRVLASRYLLKRIENLTFFEAPQYLFMRVAMGIAIAELNYGGDPIHWAKKFYDILSELKFLPNSPTLFNALTISGVLSACFVIEISDCMTKLTHSDDINCIFGIYDALLLTGILHQAGAGTGFSFTKLRPEGDVVKSTSGTASGPVSFMKLFDISTEVIKQGGRRRGAMMGILEVWHPDIEKFIQSKTGRLKDVNLQNFNISVMVPDIFMCSVVNDDDWYLINPRECRCLIESWGYEFNKCYKLCVERVERGEISIWKRIKAKELFMKIVEAAWDSGDPGMLFKDVINIRHPLRHLGTIIATNPCAEVPLLPFESCNLGSINLSKFIINGKIDWDGLRETISIAVRFLDNVIDVNKLPQDTLIEANRRSRKIGLGVMGLAEVLTKLEIPYDSDDALYLSDKLAEWIAYNAVISSIELAKERGVFPSFKGSLWSEGKIIIDTWRELEEYRSERIEIYSEDKVSSRVKEVTSERPEVDWKSIKEKVINGIRNGALMSIAPTGTISIIAGTTPSIEPLFALAFIRNVSIGKLLEIYIPFMEYALNHDFWSKIKDHVLSYGRIGNSDKIPEKVKNIFKTAHEIHWSWHIKMQIVWQKWIDQGVSKTINMPAEATIEDVYNAYLMAWKLGAKGITIFRDKSKTTQVIYLGIKRLTQIGEESTYACKVCTLESEE